METNNIASSVKFVIVAIIATLTLTVTAALFERMLWRVDCALNVPSACGAIEEIRARDWKSFHHD